MIHLTAYLKMEKKYGTTMTNNRRNPVETWEIQYDNKPKHTEKAKLKRYKNKDLNMLERPGQNADVNPHDRSVKQELRQARIENSRLQTVSRQIWQCEQFSQEELAKISRLRIETWHRILVAFRSVKTSWQHER